MPIPVPPRPLEEATAQPTGTVPTAPVTEAPLGHTYYVSDSTGDDANPGTSPDQPWRTLAKVSSTTFQPHDQILLKRGDVWDGEQLVLHGSGDFMDDSWITLGAYGEGPKPRLTNAPYDETIDISESWSAVCAAYPDQCRQYMKIAIRVDGSGWFISGLEIDHAEMGVYVPSGGARYWIEDMYFHDILGLFMPVIPGWEEMCETACPMWDPFPSPAWGNAIQFDQADYVFVRDIVVERATGGIGGFANVGWIENVLIDKATTGGLNFNGNTVTIRYATVLNGQWPSGAWYGADPFISTGDSGWVVERSEVAYTTNYDYVPGVNSGAQDASPVDFDAETVHSAMRDNFFHDNVGSCFEFNMAEGGNIDIVIENNVCYNNGLEDRTKGDYATVAFAADACGFHEGQSYILRNNVIYKAFPGQYLNYHFGAPVEFSNDFSVAEQVCGTIAENNVIYEYGEYSLPLPIPAPPPIAQVNIAPAARVTVSSGEDTAAFAQDSSLDTEWVSAEAQPWIRYEWDAPQTIDTIRLFDRPDLENWAVSGVLTFSDGSSVNVTGGILNNGAMREVVFDEPKTVTWVQFTVTRNDEKSPGTNVGLTELQVYLAAPPPPPDPTPDPGTFTVDFEDRPEAPTPLTWLRYPDTVNGVDWGADVWATAAGPDGNRYLFYDYFPRRYQYGEAATRGPMFILPRGKVLQSLRVACPAGAVVAFFQAGQPAAFATCTGEFALLETGWSAPLFSNIVGVWIDVSATTADLDDVWFDDLAYGD